MVNKKPKVSVIVIVYNEERYIAKCIESILNQSFRDFEFVIVDDCSTDSTPNIINKFKDRRIVKIRNKKNYDIAKTRNIGLKVAKGEFVFFTDADCIVEKNWIEEGLEKFRDSDVLGVKGFTYYVAKDYKLTTCDKKRGTLYERFNTSNIAYRREILQKVGKFNERRYKEAYEDEDLAQRVLKLGRIVHCKDMVVLHRKKEYSIFSIFNKLKWVKCKVHIIKDHKFFPMYRAFFITDKKYIILPVRILDPSHLFGVIFFPYLFFYCYYYRKVKSFNHFIFPFIIYFYLILKRLVIWRTAIKERIFII